MRGGKREGAGRPKGTTKTDKTVCYQRRLTPEEAKKLDEYLEKIRNVKSPD